MKVIVETIDKEKYVEIVVSDFDLDLLDDGRLIFKEIFLDKKSMQLSMRKQTQEEKYAFDSGEE